MSNNEQVIREQQLVSEVDKWKDSSDKFEALLNVAMDDVIKLKKENEELMKPRSEVESKIIKKLLAERNMLIAHIMERNKKDRE